MKRHQPSVTTDDHHRPRWATVTAAVLAFATVFGSAAAVAAQGEPFALERHRMVDEQVRQRGIEQPRVLEAMEDVPRHLFVPIEKRGLAYDDVPVEIYPDQTLSQAYVSARMISLLELDGDEKVLEIGTGSGYDAALLSRMAREVYTIEIQEELYREAKGTLDRLGYRNVHARAGDGYLGWPEEAPFDAILVTAAPERLPKPLLDQLRVGGKMVIAVGKLVQELQVITKTADGLERRKVSLVNLVPMTGQAANEH